ncbi:type I polyketide synthase [Streptomonospora litoralis]|uniref:Erythronolide synthase, modules 1 and 2 n=1 Tax=Streptomonospora litoralis TaxID=2498135 RepID=A0A4P6Q2W4_9ACTN|nr:type I polyketide synthase [Streptomonospora litoralis]QBI54873.1 Erythronolide synthase, modules 1 and 2 [Streptomonospora litoralis]
MSDEKLLAYLRKVTGELHEARRKLKEAPAADADDPIAVVAMSCRLPGGVASPEDLWELLADERDAVSGFPTDRGWPDDLYSDDPDAPGKSYVNRGGFLHDAAAFDPEAFGISPREATAMDPQQRLMLELGWEAFERARIAPSSLRGTATGVFAGACSFHYEGDYTDAPEDLGGHLITGNVTSVLSGRVSYAFGLEGPAITLDTGCSSALVAMHLAARSLRQGECSLALAGGVAVMSTPGVFVEFSRQRGLAPDGRCKAFGAAADGTGWSEGAGFVLLERLSDAEAAGHPVLAVLRGSATNQDGASNGLTAPNGRAQQRVIQRALEDAGLEAADVDAVEGHGTGTRLGDPIEANALMEAYGRRRPEDRPLLLGSVKSNIGHAQAAAGVASVIKTVLCLDRGRLPRTLHVDEPTPEVDWSRGGVELLTEPVAWPRGERVRRAGVSGFGVSGTNAHLIVEEPPEPSPAAVHAGADADPFGTPLPWVLSARGEQALRARAAQLHAHASAAPETVQDIGYSLATTRSSYEHRAVVVGEDRDRLLAGVDALRAGASSPAVVSGVAETPAAPVFVFPGQGSQWPGMARDLLESSPVFRKRMEECADALAGHVARSPLDVLRMTPGGPDDDRVDVVQPALFSVMVALAELWRSYGVEPAGVIGHSQGEIAAACVAGALSLEDAARVVALRSRALRTLAGTGGMLSLGLPPGETRELLAHWEGRLSLAAVNSPGDTVVSGDTEALASLQQAAADRGARARMVNVDYASHSAHVEEIRQTLLGDLAPVAPGAAGVAFYSTVTGDRLDTAALDADYWMRNLRRTVRLDAAAEAAHRAGLRMFVEVSPHPVLTFPLQQTLPEADVLGTLHRDDRCARRFLVALGEAYAAGAEVDWSAAFDPAAGRRVPLPTYPFQRRKHWLPPRRPAAAAPVDRLDTWHYRPSWSAVTEVAQGRARGLWLLLVPAGAGTGAGTGTGAVADALRRSGAETCSVEVDRPPERAALAARLRDAAQDREVAGVLSLAADAEDVSGERGGGVPEAVLGTLVAHQALGDAGIGAPLWCATREAVSTGAGDPAPRPRQAALWGLGTSLAAERPERWGGLVDLPADPGPRELDRMASVLGGGGEPQCAVRPGGTFARRLLRASSATAEAWVPDGTVLITGGLGGVGGRLARRLARGGARHLLLLGRRGLDTPGAKDLCQELDELGATVMVRACDAADRAALAEAIGEIPEEHPLTAVIHAAGVLDDAPADRLGPKQLRTVMSAKAASAWNLHELTRGLPLTAFVLFSSAGAVLGSAGQAGYAAANAYLDGLAEHRKALGLPATSIAWTVLKDSGMVGPDAEEWFSARGARPMEPEPAFEAMRRAIETGAPHVVVGDIDWGRFASLDGITAPGPLLAEIPEAARSAAEAEGGDARRLVLGRDADEALRSLRDLVAGQVAAVLDYGPDDAVPRERPLKELGFDSVTSVALRNRLGAACGLRLPVTLAFDHPSVAAIAGHLYDELSPDTGADAAAELERLESLLADGGDLREALVERLRSMLWKWDRGPAAPDDAEDAGRADDLRDATDEEMFQLLDNELGTA